VSEGDRYLIEGQGITEFPGHGTAQIGEYAKTATVLAAVAMQDGVVNTPEGKMSFKAGDFIVTDNPPTHCWPVKREVFQATYEVVSK
jgi:hypothetical protein